MALIFGEKINASSCRHCSFDILMGHQLFISERQFNVYVYTARAKSVLEIYLKIFTWVTMML